ncbi:MAG: hypothetical protein IT423_14170 [Pirellulaceae bacterium]|nr:hypothetical protein [Pirellulaceae bacterium]
MWTRWTIIGCVVLTALVVHTAIRIEHVNVLSNTYLPRSPGEAQQEWVLPELSQVLEYVDHQIAIRRADAYAMTHPGTAIPANSEFLGAPYTEDEQNWIDRSKRDFASHTELHWWVTNFGSPQYLLAPLAFIWSVGNFLTVRKNTVRVLSTACALMAFGAIFLMIFRGY